mgnify:CR=1 FL=1
MLAEEIERHIVEYRVDAFVVGHYGQFDSMATHAVIQAKQKHPEITLTLLLPYHPTVRPIKTPKGHAGPYYPPGLETVPPRLAIVKATMDLHNQECTARNTPDGLQISFALPLMNIEDELDISNTAVL